MSSDVVAPSRLKMARRLDTELLISLVKARPTLWDKGLESHKDHDQRSAAWRDICKVLCPEYEMLTRKDKHGFAKSVIKKWTNVRDAWRKSLDTKSRKRWKPYLYHDYLRFLEKNFYYVKEPPFLNDDDIKKSKVDSEEGEKIDKAYSLTDSDDASDVQCSMSCEGESSSGVRKRRIGEPQEAESSFQLVDVQSLSRRPEESPHICFLRGLLPTLNKLDDDEVLEFQAGTIQLLQQIRKARTPIIEQVVSQFGNPSSSIDVNSLLSHIKEDPEGV